MPPETADRPPPEAPRIGRSLEAVADLELVDDLALDGARVTGASLPDGEASGVDLVGCHLVGLRLTAAALDGLRLLDVVVEGCELPGGVAGGGQPGPGPLRALPDVGGGAGRVAVPGGRDQVVAVAVPVLAALGITVDDDG